MYDGVDQCVCYVRKSHILNVALKNIQGREKIENILVKCLVKCTQANFKAKVQFEAFLHLKK